MSSVGGNETQEGLCKKFLLCLIDWFLSAQKKFVAKEKKDLPVSVWGTGYSSLSLAGGGSPLNKQLSATCTTTFSTALDKLLEILSISRSIVFPLLVNLDINLCKNVNVNFKEGRAAHWQCPPPPKMFWIIMFDKQLFVKDPQTHSKKIVKKIFPTNTTYLARHRK